MVTGMIDTVVDFVGGLVGSLADTIVGDLIHAVSVFLGTRLLLFVQLVMELVHAAYSLFSVFAGITKIRWDGEYTYLFHVFFQNSAINGVYWGMAMIGFVLLFGFSIVAVIRKMFDLGDQEQRSIGQILGSGFKGFLVIISLTAILTAGTTLTNLLVQQVGYVFDQGNTLTKENDMEFTDEQYATMARILNTIGNYSLNPGYAQKYNLNACYNEIRPDLLYLQNQGVFDYFYPDVDAAGEPERTWQSELQKLILANDPNHALKMDPYYEAVSNALLEIMAVLQTDAEFYPVSHIRNNAVAATEVPLDRVLFLSGTMNAAKNELYNQDPGFDDSLRGAFYSGDKSIYNFFDVTEAFDIGLGSINYLLILLGAYWVLKNLFRCLLNCTSRIVNIIGLYIAAPPLAAAMPLDGGKRFREWTNSMVIQMIGIFGNIIPMRLVMLFLPIIMSSKLRLVDSTMTNVIGKVFIVWGMLEAVGRFNGVLTSILANNGAGGAMRGIESMNKTADTRFSRYGGRYIRGTTDLDAASGRGGDRGGLPRIQMGDQRNFRQQNGGGTGGGNESQLKAKAVRAGMMAATGGASAGMGGLGGSGGGPGRTGGPGGSGSGAEPEEHSRENGPGPGGNAGNSAYAQPNAVEAYRTGSPEERQRTHDALFGPGRSDAATGKAFSRRESDAASDGSGAEDGLADADQDGEAGSGQSRSGEARPWSPGEPAKPQTRSQLEALFGRMDDQEWNELLQKRADRNGEPRDPAGPAATGSGRTVPKRAAPPPRPKKKAEETDPDQS